MLKHNALIFFLGLWSIAATAQVPVVEAGGNNAPRGAQAPSGNELVLSLYNQLEALQQEVQTLRGMVEEQSNQMRRLQTEQRDRYIDIDRRLSELSGTGAIGASPTVLPGTVTNTPVPATGAPAITPPLNDPQGRPPFGSNTSLAIGVTPSVSEPLGAGVQSADTQMNEQDLYRAALNLLLEEDQYEESIRMFQSYIDRFPQGRYLTNAYYWQGEALILASRFNEARDVFIRLMTNYPDVPKAAGAMLKLGVAYRRMGDEAMAQQTWREIAARYPENATEIRAAQDYLSGQ